MIIRIPFINSKTEPKTSPYEITVNKTWEDGNLPSSFKANAWKAVYKGKEEYGFLIFEGIGFGIPKNKIPDLKNLKIGDNIEVVKLNHEGTDYGGDGIIIVTNLKTGKTTNYGDWQRKRKEDIDISGSVKNIIN